MTFVSSPLRVRTRAWVRACVGACVRCRACGRVCAFACLRVLAGKCVRVLLCVRAFVVWVCVSMCASVCVPLCVCARDYARVRVSACFRAWVWGVYALAGVHWRWAAQSPAGYGQTHAIPWRMYLAGLRKISHTPVLSGTLLGYRRALSGHSGYSMVLVRSMGFHRVVLEPCCQATD